MRYHTILIYICTFLFYLKPIYGADSNDNYYFRNYTNKDGLSHNTVYCSLQDSKGFMWFGTDDGLNRFDGYSFKIYRYNSQSTQYKCLLHNRIISLLEDPSGKIWITTLGGVCYYDYETDSFHPFILENQEKPFYADQMLMDEDRNIWFRDYFTIAKYNIDNQKIKLFSYDDTGFYSRTMTRMKDGRFLFANTSSLFIGNPQTQTFEPYIQLDNYLKNRLTVIQCLSEIPDSGIFIGTDLEGLLFYDYKNKKVETTISDIHVRAIIQYSNDTYWVASESGIYILNLRDHSIINLRKSLTNEYTIADNAVYSLSKDREGGVWVGSFFGGINYLPKNHNNFTYYIGGKTHQGMLGNTVREICPDKYGNLWLATEDNGVNCLNLKTNTIVNYSLRNKERKLSATNIHGLYADGDTLWIGSFNKGIDLFHIPTRKVIKTYSQTNTDNALVSNFVLCFFKSSQGEFLIGTVGGVVIYDKENDTFYRWNNIWSMVRQFIEDKEGNIWVATNGGLYRIGKDHSPQKENMKHYVSTSKTHGLGSSDITSVFEDSNGRIWVTTTYGFSLYDKNTDSFNLITTENGLPSSIIYRIVEDKEHLFWISTANGLVKFNPETYEMRIYTSSDGLYETQFNFSSSYQSKDGRIFMGTINGMISFNPEKFMGEDSPPLLYITNVQVLNAPKKNIDFFKDESNKPLTLVLPYNQATFTISYIAPNYTSPDAIKYSYLFEDNNEKWIYMDKERKVSFASLTPGKYTFKVRSTNTSEVWQNNTQVLKIVITPPFWRTTWAYILYTFLIIIVLVSFYTYKKRKITRDANRSKELFEIKKEKELYNAKMQFFTFLIHEIRTPLTLIYAPLKKSIKLKNQSDELKQYLDIINRNTQRLIDLCNQLLDFRKIESNSFHLNLAKADVTLIVQNILTQIKPSFLDEGKTLEEYLGDTHLITYLDTNAFSKIVMNLLTNALKYSDKNTVVELKELENNKFVIIVTNDGLTIPEEERENIFTTFYRFNESENIQGSGIGLALSRNLAELHKGAIDYQVSETGLNQFVLTMPIYQEDKIQTDTNSESSIIVQPDLTNEKTSSLSQKRYAILIAEDQQDMRNFIANELKSNYDVFKAENGQKALDILKTRNIDIIISDVIMPVMDGFKFCNYVKNNLMYCHIPFILLTAKYNLESRLTGLNQGADVYMEKPFSMEHLIVQIENLIKNRELLLKSYHERPLATISSLASSTIDNEFLNILTTYIDKNLTNENLSVDMIANELNMSNSSLYRKVKGISGLSPVDFIRICRLKKAIQLMEEGEKRISEIAYLVGFSSPAYFSSSFQKQYGKSPSEFIKEMGSAH